MSLIQPQRPSPSALPEPAPKAEIKSTTVKKATAPAAAQPSPHAQASSKTDARLASHEAVVDRRAKQDAQSIRDYLASRYSVKLMQELDTLVGADENLSFFLPSPLADRPTPALAFAGDAEAISVSALPSSN
jgi:hypothetical protein